MDVFVLQKLRSQARHGGAHLKPQLLGGEVGGEGDTDRRSRFEDSPQEKRPYLGNKLKAKGLWA